MRKQRKRKGTLILGSILAVLSVVYICLIATVDVQPLGLENTNIGFATINTAVAAKLPYSAIFYKISSLLGYSAFLIVAFFVVCGVVQLVKRKSLAKVDRSILAMGALFVITIILYVAFDKIVINYRPVILPGELELESSFPSSHTMLAIVVFGSAAIDLKRRLKGNKVGSIIGIVLCLLMLLIVVCRFLSGAHWLTDIVGGVLIAGALVAWYAYFSKK